MCIRDSPRHLFGVLYDVADSCMRASGYHEDPLFFTIYQSGIIQQIVRTPAATALTLSNWDAVFKIIGSFNLPQKDQIGGYVYRIARKAKGKLIFYLFCLYRRTDG